MPHALVVFDAYGTLFDVSAAARRAAQAPGRAAFAAQHEDLARIWREKQIGYSWWRAVTGAYTSFWQVTGDALDYALAETGLNGDAELRASLMDLYHRLEAYAEVPAVLGTLRRQKTRTAILSNGSPDMLQAATASAGIEELFDAVLSVEAVGTFKPSARVYDLVGATFDVGLKDVLFVSSNGWDIAAAAGYGFDTAWVNRAGLPCDRLPHAPMREIRDLTPVPAIAAENAA